MGITISGGEAGDIVLDLGSGEGRSNLWITVLPGAGRPAYSLNINPTEEGLVVDGYFQGHEDREPSGTIGMFDGDLDDVLHDIGRPSRKSGPDSTAADTVAVSEGAGHD